MFLVFARVPTRSCEIFDVASFPLISRSCEFVCAIKFNRIVVHVSEETVQHSYKDDVFSRQKTVAAVTLCVWAGHTEVARDASHVHAMEQIMRTKILAKECHAAVRTLEGKQR